MAKLWARKPITLLMAEAEERSVQASTTHGGVPLKRALSATSLVALGIGAVIGAGIFVLTGHAAAAGYVNTANWVTSTNPGGKHSRIAGLALPVDRMPIITPKQA